MSLPTWEEHVRRMESQLRRKLELCNCCNKREAQVMTNGGPACDWCRNNCVQEPTCFDRDAR